MPCKIVRSSVSFPYAMRFFLVATYCFLTLFPAFVSPSAAAPVAVNDTFSTNEDTALIISTAPFLNEGFDGVSAVTDSRGFEFIRNIFELGSNQGGSGFASDIDGNPPGGLTIIQQLSANTGITRNSGWRRTFTVSTAQTIRVTFDYRLTTDGGVGANAASSIRMRLGTTGTVTTVEAVTGPNQNTGWKTAVFNIPVAAGTQTLQFGVVGGNNNTGGGQSARGYFDNVRVEPANNSGVLANDTGGAVSAVIGALPTHGTLDFTSSGTFTYTPDANYFGPDSFTYRAVDAAGAFSNFGTVALTINSVNDAPVAVADSYTTTENVTLVVSAAEGVLVNDFDIEGSTLSATVVAQPAHGSVTMSANGGFTYVPVAGYSGTDVFTYRVSDGVANSNTVNVSITLNPVNDPPTAVDDTYTALKNQVLNVTATSSSGAAVLIPAGATWKYLDDGSNQGTAWRAPSFSDASWKTGVAEFGYGEGDEATVVEDDATPGSPTPGSTTRYITTYFRHTFTIANKATLRDLVLSVKRDDGAVVILNGTVISDANMQAGLPNNPTYTQLASSAPDDGQTFNTINLVNGQDLLVEGTNVIAVEVHQTSSDSSDVSFDLSLTATRGGAEALINAGAIWKYLDNGTNQGTAWRALEFGDGSWASGPAELGYGDIPDGRPEATVVEDDATPGSPTPGSTSRYITTYFRHTFNVTNKDTLKDLVLSILRDDGAVVYLNGTVISNATIHNGLSSNPAYTDLANNAPAADEFTFIPLNLVNGESLLNEGLNVIAVEIHQNTPSSSDISFNLSLTANRTAVAGVLANDIEPDGQALSATLVTPPTYGQLTLDANGTFSYTPNANFLGQDSFVYAASDGSFSSNATARINVTAGANSAPLAVDDRYTATEDTTLTVSAASGVLLNDSDSDGNPITATLLTQPANGNVVLAANGSFTYTPSPNYFGNDSFTYRASDGLLNSIPATVFLTVNGTPDAPVAQNDSYFMDRGVTLTVSVASGVLRNDSDADGQSLIAQIVGAPASGSLNFAPDGSFTYTPLASFSGTVTFTYRASDGSLASSVATVTILVNSRPHAAADVYTATEDITLNVPAPGVLGNDSDPDNDPITAVLVNNASHGVVTLNSNGSFTYVPVADFFGADSFTYRATDGTRDSVDALVTINVAGVNDAPIAVDDRYDLPVGEETSVTVAQGVLANDTDPDTSVLSAELLNTPATGTLVWNANGSFRYKPAAGFQGTETFSYRVNDGVATSAPATVTLNVQNQTAIFFAEIMFNPASGQPKDEWVELRNSGTTAVNLRGWQISRGVGFTFPDITLAAGGSLIVAADVPAFRALFPSVVSVTGPWAGSLSNRGEQIRIDNALGRKIDAVRYSDQGDWADRRILASSGQNGWQWISGADGSGQSLQLRNLALPHDNGQNWTSAAPTPGASNSGVNATNLAPLIYEVKQTPQLPTPTQQVHVTAIFADESLAAPTARVTYRTWTRPAASDTTSTPTAWVNSLMSDDGLHGDGAAGDGKFGATVPAMPTNTIVEFYVHVSDGANVRTWPAPTDAAGTQGANALYYVETPGNPGTRPFYRLVMTGQDEINFRFENWPSASDAALNATFVAQQGNDVDIRYRAAVRVRGASSRDRSPRNWRIDLPHDSDWQGRVAINLNTQYIYNQLIGSRLMELAGLAREDATVVQVRMNGINHATDSQNNRRFGHYIDLKPVNSDFADEQFPNDSAGNLYRKVRPDNKWAARGPVGAPNVANYITDGWSKETNSTINDWTDLHALLRTFTDTAAGPGYFPAVSAVANVDQFVRWFALSTIINHRETNLSNGADDDYSMYRGILDPRFQLIGHDFDTLFGIGDTTTSPTAGIYQVIDGFGGTTIPVFQRFFQDNTIARKYKAQLRDLLGTLFTGTNFNATVDNLLPIDWIPAPHGQASSDVPENLQTAIKTFMNTRRAHLLTLLPTAFTATTSLPVQNGLPTTTSATNTGLSGVMDAARTARITVNGTTVPQSNYTGAWSAGSAVTLRPGVNTLACLAYDEAGAVIATSSVQIFFEKGSTSTRGGMLTASDTWTADGGPYSVSSNLTVPNGLTLTIQAGASVFINPGVSFTVAAGGRLLAEGTADAPITFSKAPTATGTWSGLLINGGTNELESRISYASFDNNGGVAIHARNGARVVLDHLMFRNTAQPYLSLDGSSFVVSNTFFPAATAGFEPVHGTQGIAQNGEGIIRDCVFGAAIGYNDVIDFTGGNRPGPILQILNNVFLGSGDDILDLDSTDAWIEGNVFLHAHRNGSPDSASAISGGADNADRSQVTIIRNLIYDCDHAVTMKQGNSFALLQNTIVHITKTGGLDTASAVVNLADDGTTAGAGGVIEGNIIWDVEALTRNYAAEASSVVFRNNLLPVAWNGPGSGNVVTDPFLNLSRIPNPATATEAEVRAAFVLQDCSPAIGTSPFGGDQGAVANSGISLLGVPESPTPGSAAVIVPGPNGIFNSYEYGYTHYRFALDGGPLSSDRTSATPITLTGLNAGTHTLEVFGKNDAGVWQSLPTTVTWIVDPAAVPVLINEVLASNVNAYPVGASRPDVIELHNYGSFAVDLSNYSITDDAANPRKFVFPTGTAIPAKGYLLLFADSLTANPGIHTGFGLSVQGDSVLLFRPNAVTGSRPIDSVTFGVQLPDYSIARHSSTRAWSLSTLTPGAANATACVLGNPAQLRINEWLSANQFVVGSDFLELYNPEILPVALGGLYLTDDLGNAPFKHPLAPLSFIAAGGFVAYIADGSPEKGSDHLSFAISRVHETLSLTDMTGRVLDVVPVVSQVEDQSQGRSPDGGSRFAYFALPTPGFSNSSYSGAQAASFEALINNLRITEMMYQPSSSSRSEFIELKNISATQTLDLSGVSFTSGITYTFPLGTNLAPGAYYVIAEHLGRFQTQFPGVPAVQWTSGKLDNSGERVRIEITPFGLGVLDFEYSDTWYPTTAGGGASLQFIDPLQLRDAWSEKQSWQASAVPNPGGPPVFSVDAGADFTLAPGSSGVLRGSIVYGPYSASNVTFSWAKVSGPGNPNFAAPASLVSDVAFSSPGVYLLSLTARESGGNTTVADTVQVIATEDYTSWSTRLITNPALRGEGSDVDGDGLNNFLEFSTGSDPQAYSGSPVQLEVQGEDLILTYRRDLGVSGVSYLVQESLGLAVWSAANASETSVSRAGTVETVRATVPKATGGRQFLRLRVSR